MAQRYFISVRRIKNGYIISKSTSTYGRNSTEIYAQKKADVAAKIKEIM